MINIFTDQMNNAIRLEGIPSRIVSLVPSQTELLFELGLRDEVVGITKFCIYPEEWFQGKVKVGGTKKLNFDKIKALKPDLIIGNKEENTQEDIVLLSSIAPVWMSDIFNLEDAYQMIEQLGSIVGKEMNSKQLLIEIKSKFSGLRKIKKDKSVLYFIWKDPYFAVGKKTFIDSVLSECGFKNFCTKDRYPEWQVKSDSKPDYVFLSSEPYPFKNEHIKELEKLFPSSKVVLVDGEMFSWYGSRMKLAPAYLQNLLDHLSNH